MIKKILFIVFLLSACSTFLMSCSNSNDEQNGAETNDQGLQFYLREDGTYAVALGDESRFLSKIVLPETYRGKPVVEFTYNSTQSGNPDYYIFNLVSLTIPKTITKFNIKALNGCNKLVEVINHSDADFSDHLSVVIGDWHEILEIHSGPSKIENYKDFYFLTSNGVNYLMGYSGSDEILNLPKDFKGESYQIHDYAFYNCTGIKSIRISRNVSRIGTYIFYFYPTLFTLDTICYEGSEEEFGNIPGSGNILFGEGINVFNYSYDD